MNTLNKILMVCFCLSVIGSKTSASPGGLISREIEQEGNLICVSEEIQSPNPIRVFLVDDKLIGEWTLEILTINDEYCTAQKKSGLPVYEIDHVKNLLQYNPLWFYEDGSDHKIFKIRVIFRSEGGEQDSIDLKFDLLPTPPVINNVKFSYTFNWETNEIWPNGKLSFDVISERAGCFLLGFSYDCLFETPDEFPYWHIYEAKGKTTTIVYDAEWGEYITVKSLNGYGEVMGDTICTTDYIIDEDILKRIHNLQLGSVEQSELNDNGDIITKWDNNTLTFETIVEEIYVFDIAGRLCLSKKATDKIEMSDLTEGIYIIAYQVKSKQYKFKITKI